MAGEETAGKEPGNWELYRGIERIEKTLGQHASTFVTQQVFAIEKASIMTTIAGQGTEIADLKAENERLGAEAKTAKAARDEAASRMRLFWIGLFAGPAATLLVVWIASGALNARPGG